MTFGQTFARCLSRMFLWVGIIATIVYGGALSQNHDPAERPMPVGSPTHQFSLCTPANDGPVSYALIQRPNSGVERVYSDQKIGRALDDAFKIKDWKNVRVLRFCK